MNSLTLNTYKINKKNEVSTGSTHRDMRVHCFSAAILFFGRHLGWNNMYSLCPAVFWKLSTWPAYTKNFMLVSSSEVFLAISGWSYRTNRSSAFIERLFHLSGAIRSPRLVLDHLCVIVHIQCCHTWLLSYMTSVIHDFWHDFCHTWLLTTGRPWPNNIQSTVSSNEVDNELISTSRRPS